ncbi:mitochondrial import receptor subunit TOM22 homolog isoform X2 [Bacillus rossius redtenbacheri]|uniref:mitochondrial import receptor subunit TOM22 homolog isoform X2 n=1 Tax=Bacillus rossius redtenbacheri TaxID=93214 RepID=UPI002FDC9EF8
MARGEDSIDSGMASLTTSSKDLTPEKVKSDDDFEDDEEDEDETLVERLVGLGEMFPPRVRDATHIIATTTCKAFYGFACSAAWVVFSSSIILFAPLIFEVERAQMEEAQRSQQKQVLLGPNSAMAGSMGGTLKPPPPTR